MTIAVIGTVVILILFMVGVVKTLEIFDRMSEENRNSGIAINDTSLTLYDLASNEVRVVSLKEDSLFIHFWATWCKPCVREMASLNSLIEQNPGYKFYFISTEEPEVVQSFLRERGYHNIQGFTIKNDENPIVLKLIPTTFIRTNDSSFRKIVGTYNWSEFFEGVLE